MVMSCRPWMEVLCLATAGQSYMRRALIFEMLLGVFCMLWRASSRKEYMIKPVMNTAALFIYISCPFVCCSVIASQSLSLTALMKNRNRNLEKFLTVNDSIREGGGRRSSRSQAWRYLGYSTSLVLFGKNTPTEAFSLWEIRLIWEEAMLLLPFCPVLEAKLRRALAKGLEL